MKSSIRDLSLVTMIVTLARAVMSGVSLHTRWFRAMLSGYPLHPEGITEYSPRVARRGERTLG